MTSAHSQQYSLRWNNYLRHITFAFESLRTNDEFVDVTLCCDGHKIRAHKMLLSACSGYFKEIFKENPHPHPIIIFKFIKYEDLNSIIEFMYQGEVNVQQEALQSFLQTAELLAVQGLTSEEKPKAPKSPTEEHIIKSIPSSIRTISENSTPQTQTIELQTVSIPNIIKKRKITFNTEDEGTTIYTTTTDSVTLREDPRNIGKGTTEIQYLPSAKIEVPEYIDVSDCTQITETTQTNQVDENNTQSANQFTSEYEILTESEIDEKFPSSDSTENAELIQIDRLLNASQESIDNTKEEKVSMSQDGESLGELSLQCSVCDRRLQSISALRRHNESKHSEKLSKHLCAKCNKSFKTKWSLSTHNSRFHRELKHKECIKIDLDY